MAAKEQNSIDHRTLDRTFEKGQSLDFYPSPPEGERPRRVLIATPEDDVACRCAAGFTRLGDSGWQVTIAPSAAGAREHHRNPIPPTIALVRVSLAQNHHGTPYQREATLEGALELVSFLLSRNVPVIPWTPEIGLGRLYSSNEVIQMERLTHQPAFSSLAGACMQGTLAAVLNGTDPYTPR